MENRGEVRTLAVVAPKGDFVNEAFTNFGEEAAAARMRVALATVRSALGMSYPLVIGGKRMETAEKIRSVNPAHPAELVGLHQKAGEAEAEAAMRAALEAFANWRKVSAAERASLLLRTAELLRERKYEFMAWLVFETGKNWAEADADAGEAVDFLEFYAREALRLAGAKTPIQYPGERNELHYIPLGVGAIIPPWNFPLAILAGMTAAAIVCGNTAILKPSSDAPTVAARFFALLEEAGMPAGVVNFCPGSGPSFGQRIVEHPKTRFISFTGSKAVGLGIHEAAAKTGPGQIWIKRTILEMGGKDSILVTKSANLDAAADAIVASAFGFSGQKCSACSRAIVDAAVYDAIVARLVERVQRLTVGDPAGNPSLGPVINETAYKQILAAIERGNREGKLLFGGHPVANQNQGYLIEPTIFGDVAPEASLAQEEIFGPVLALIKVADFEQGLRVANNTEYGLTGSIYSQDRAELDRARRDFHVGNLYFNRKCTGAMVGAHPFGGFNMSGTDSKAGGPDYLYLFSQAKSVAEKL